MRRAAVAVVVASVLAACSGPRMIWDHHSAEIGSYYRYAAQDGRVTAVIAGAPFAGSEAATREAVVQAMASGMQGHPQAAFVPWDRESPLQEPYFVVALNAAVTQQAWKLCGLVVEEPADTVVQRDLRMTMAFCAAGRLLSEVEAILPHPAGPEDPAFRNVLQEAMGRLVPLRETKGPESDDLRP